MNIDITINRWIQETNVSGDIYKPLNLQNFYLQKLPDLPWNLKYLKCGFNKLESIYNLPESLEILDCKCNYLKYIKLPINLKELHCNNNQLTSIDLNENLVYLDCSDNKLKNIIINKNLGWLFCQFNELTSLSDLTNLYYLNCNHNLLTNLQTLSTNLNYLNCMYNPFLYNRINIIKKFPNNEIFNYNYSFSNYAILLKLQRKQHNKTKNKLNKILLTNMKLYNDHIRVILRYI